MVKRILSIILAVLIIILLAGAVIAYSRGYRIDLDKKTLSTTGILSVASYPQQASIILDGKLTSVTNASLTLSPDWYDLRVSRDGYQNWEKRVRVQGEVVTQIDALLIPTNPSLRALTTSGILAPSLSGSGTQVAYIVPQDESIPATGSPPKTGVWIIELRSSTLPLSGRSQPRQVFATRTAYDWPNSTLTWSPDERALMITFINPDRIGVNPKDKNKPVNRALLISLVATSESILSGTDVTATYKTILSQWSKDQKEENDVQIATLPPIVSNLLTNSASQIQFAPDDKKILYVATASATLAPVISPSLIGSNSTQESRTITSGAYYVYDRKEDKNFLITDGKTLASPTTIRWYSDAKHIILIEKDTINIIDYDGTNKRTVYAGPFEKTTLFSWPQGGKIVITTNLNNSKQLPNLYEVDLR